MKPASLRNVIFVLILAILTIPRAVDAAEVFQFASDEIRMEILSREDFEARFGANPDVPRTDEAILSLAAKIYLPLEEETIPAWEGEAECGYPRMSSLMAGLQNPAISDETRRRVDELMATAVPDLPREEIFGHFKFKWTDNNSNELHNVTREDIRALSLYLNRYWNVYTDIFGIEPQCYEEYGEKLIDIKVFYFGEMGSTHNSLKYINLNSKSVVKDPCRRRSVSAHELFHRVQFRCGLEDPYPGVMWLAEGTAVWAMKWALAAGDVSPVYDYVNRMNEGLANTDKNLLLNRAYDSAHFWVYLADRAGWEAIRDVWTRYRTQAQKDPRAAVAAVVQAKLGLDFDHFLHKWHKTNYIQGLANAPSEYDYALEGTSHVTCGATRRLRRVQINAAHKISSNSTRFTFNGRVAPYGADYYRFALGDQLTRVRVRVTGEAAGNFSYFFMGVRSNKGQEPVKQSFARQCEFYKTLKPGEWGQLIMIVAGRSEGGDYTVQVIPAPGGADCINGYWQQDGSIEFWHLAYDEVADMIKGSYVGFPGCNLLVRGTYSEPNIQFSTTTDPARQDCYRVSMDGVLAGCRWIYATRTTRYDSKGTFYLLKKVTAPSAPHEE